MCIKPAPPEKYGRRPYPASRLGSAMTTLPVSVVTALVSTFGSEIAATAEIAGVSPA
jgi:hypothetical protein